MRFMPSTQGFNNKFRKFDDAIIETYFESSKGSESLPEAMELYQQDEAAERSETDPIFVGFAL